MADETKKRTPYPVDPNVTGAFPGGPPQIPAETTERILKNPAQARQEFQRRMARALKHWEEAAAAEKGAPKGNG